MLRVGVLPVLVALVPALFSCGSVLESTAEARRCEPGASPLLPDEEQVAATGELAARFNPAMAFPSRDIWPVDVSYAWHDGSPLVARVKRGLRTVEREARSATDLGRHAWGDLPGSDPDGRNISYGIDAPGDDELENGVSRWVTRWRAINGGDVADDRVRTAPYPPTQYAHVFWVDRKAGQLGIQYYFFYPYNEWLNHHEGDWEHINVVLQGPSRLTPGARFRVLRYEFFFHDWSMIPRQVMMSSEPGEHVTVFVGGHGRVLAWSGEQSGGSYPMPAVYRHAGGGPHVFRATEDASRPKRFVPASGFRIVMLPEPERLDGTRPELGWLKIDMRIGQSRMSRNPPFVEAGGSGSPPKQPAHSAGWDRCRMKPPWGHDEPLPGARSIPPEWAVRMGSGLPASAVTLQESAEEQPTGS